MCRRFWLWSWMKVGDMQTCSISSGTTEFTEDADMKMNRYYQVAESKNKGLGTTLWHMQVFACEAGKALEKRWHFNHRSLLDTQGASRVPAQGRVQRHRKGKQRASLGSSNQHAWNMGIRVRSGKGERLKEQQGLDSFSISWTKFIESLPHAMNCIQYSWSSGYNERERSLPWWCFLFSKRIRQQARNWVY